LWLLPHQHRQRADMIEMSVRKQKSIDFLAGEVSEQRQGRFALLLRMHAAIEHDPLLARTQIVTIGADLRPTRQIDELQNRAPLCQPCAREQSANLAASNSIRSNMGAAFERRSLKISTANSV